MYRRRKMKQRQAAEHEFYESPSGNPEAWSEEGLRYPTDALFPGPRETRFLDSQNRSTFTFDPGDIQDRIDWAVGGVPGMTKFVGSMGVTSPYTVDAHDFRGMSQIVRRMPDTNYGPVKTSEIGRAHV